MQVSQRVFTYIVTCTIIIYFADPDGDFIAFSTDEELCEALGFVSDGVLKVYVKAKGNYELMTQVHITL